MEEIKNVVSVTLTKEDFRNLFEPILDSIMKEKEISETTKFVMTLSASTIFQKLEKIIFDN